MPDVTAFVPRYITSFNVLPGRDPGKVFHEFQGASNGNLTYPIKQGSRGSLLTQPGFAIFGKGMQHLSGCPDDGAEQLY